MKKKCHRKKSRRYDVFKAMFYVTASNYNIFIDEIGITRNNYITTKIKIYILI